MEKMLVTEALDERDFLRKKITKQIRSLKVITVIRNGDPRTDAQSGNITREEFESKAMSDYQSIKDSIARYNRINAAITLSNANTKIKVNDIEMTVAEAIARRSMVIGSDDISIMLQKKLEDEYSLALSSYESASHNVQHTKNNYIESLLTADNNKELSEAQIDAIDKVIEPIIPNYIDPINIKEQIDKLEAANDSILSKINTAIKISNASTYIEF